MYNKVPCVPVRRIPEDVRSAQINNVGITTPRALTAECSQPQAITKISYNYANPSLMPKRDAMDTSTWIRLRCNVPQLICATTWFSHIKNSFFIQSEPILHFILHIVSNKSSPKLTSNLKTLQTLLSHARQIDSVAYLQ